MAPPDEVSSENIGDENHKKCYSNVVTMRSAGMGGKGARRARVRP